MNLLSHQSSHNPFIYVMQSTLDSWFVPAMGAIAESESLLRRVVPDDQGFNPEDPDPKKVSLYHICLYSIQMCTNIVLDLV